MAPTTPSTVLLATAGVITLLVLSRWLRARNPDAAPLPPGPKGLPLIGNINDLPPPGIPEYQHWLKFKDLYGPLGSITLLGQTMIVIHDKEIAFELMEKRANKYSGRPSMKFGFDMVGWADTMSSLSYGATHRLYRKYTYQQIGSKTALAKYHTMQEVAVGRFLWKLDRDGGGNLVQHLNTQAAEIILDIVYGYAIDPHAKDPLVDNVDRALEQFSAAVVPGRWAVDTLPFLERIPDWMPGTNFKRTARAWRQTLMNSVNAPYEFSKTQMSHDPDKASFVAKSVEQARREKTFGEEEEHAIKWSAASMYTGGADTSVSTMVAFFLAMSMYPDVQRKAREEIDRVVGASRLPSFQDRESLPYVNAVIEEAQRWHPIAPMGLPHMADEEDEINGLRIPKGAILLPAIWWYTRDPAVYHDPEVFKPERFLEPHNEPSPTNVTFGFGRRICPGKVLADASLYLTFVQSLAAFDIRKSLDASGKEIEPEHTFGSGIIAHLGQFAIKVMPRSSQHAQLIEKVVMEHPWGESSRKYLKHE